MSGTSQESGVRRLRRSREHRVLGGVCGGLGEYLGVDPVVVRLVAVLLVAAGGAGIVAYVIAWIVIPEAEPEGMTIIRPAIHDEAEGRARVIAGAVLVCIGGLLLVDLVVPVSLDHRYVWPLLLIVIGSVIIARGSGR